MHIDYQKFLKILPINKVMTHKSRKALRQEMMDHIQACKNSNLSTIEYCKEQGLPLRAYYYLHRRIKKR